MKKFVLISLLLLPLVCNAQSIVTTTNDKIDIISSSSVHLIMGDTVKIHAYKKKDGRFNYIIETKDFADLVSLDSNPFNVDEKRLKKLPNALSNESSELLNRLKNDVEKRKHAAHKKKALSGKVSVTITDFLALTRLNEDAIGEIKEGDEIHVLGYSCEGSGIKLYKYALYNDYAVGVFASQVSNCEFLNNKIGANYLPSINDVDVQRILNEKKEQLINKIKDTKINYKNKALNGEFKGCLAINASNLTNNVGKKSPFVKNDTITILGYSKGGNNNYYAIYSDKGAGVYKELLAPSLLFHYEDELDFNYLPPVDDPDVKLLLDSIQISITRKSLEELENSKRYLIATYKEHEPVIVQLNSMSSNSVGGITLGINVINCSTQTIKYITIQGYFTNAVGDKCRNDIDGSFTWKGKGVGPIGPRPTDLDNFYERYSQNETTYTFDDLTFYSRVAESFHFSSVSIQYMNGKTITLSGSSLKKHVK